MIYLVTVHHETDRWIPLQAQSVGRWLPEARVFAVSDYPAPGHFYRRLSTAEADAGFRPPGSAKQDWNHAHRLDRLAATALAEADADDILLTLDSDALFIADPRPVLARLADYPLVAVCRDREATEAWKRHQPHPSFSALRVATWRERRCTWTPTGWRQGDGSTVVAAGGQLLKAFGDDWLRLRRLNVRNPHHLMFGVYGEDGSPLIYHHGAGSRVPIFALEKKQTKRPQWPATVAANQTLSDSWFTRAQADPDFWRELAGVQVHEAPGRRA